MQLVHVLGQDAAGGLVGFVNDIADLVVDLGGDVLAVAAALAEVAAKEGLTGVGAVDDGAEPLREAVARDHGAGGGGGAFQVVGSAGGDIVQHELFGHAAAQQADDVFAHGGLGDVAGVLFGQIHREAAGRAARDDADLVHGVVRLAEVAGDGVAGLVVGGQALFLVGDDAALLFRPGHDLDRGFLDLGFGDGLLALAGGQQGGLVDKVLKVCAREPGCRFGDGAEVDVGAERLVFGVHAQDRLAALDVGQADVDLAVKAAGAQQGFVEDVRAVGGGHDDDAVVGVEAVHLDKQLVERLFALVVPAAETRAALAADRVDLVDEDDGGHRLFGFFKQVAHAGRADADIHLDEVGAGDRVERHARLARAGAGQQRFAGARGADKQHAVRDARAERVELVGGFEEFNNLLQFGFFLVRARNVGKGGLALAFLLVLDLGAADVHQPAAPGAAAVHRHEQQHDAADHEGVEQDLKPGDGGAQAHHVVFHGGVGVGFVVRVDIPLHIVEEIGRVGQLVGDGDDAAVLGAFVLKAGQVGEEPARRALRLQVGFVRQRVRAFLQAQFDLAGVEVKVEVGDLVGGEPVHDLGHLHGGGAGLGH